MPGYSGNLNEYINASYIDVSAISDGKVQLFEWVHVYLVKKELANTLSNSAYTISTP